MAQQRILSAQVPAVTGAVVPYPTLNRDNAHFYYQDLSCNRLPSVFQTRHEEMTPKERVKTVMERFFVSWLVRLANVKSSNRDVFHNLYAVFVLKDNDQGRKYAEMMEGDQDVTQEIMAAHDAVAGVLWVALKEDRGKPSMELLKFWKSHFGSNKRARRAVGASTGAAATFVPMQDDDDDDGENANDGGGDVDGEDDGEPEITAAGRVLARMEIERNKMGGRFSSERGSFTSLMRLAAGIQTPNDFPFDLSGPADFSILVGCPTACAMLSRAMGEPQYEDAWLDPDRFFTLDRLRLPPNTFVPCGAFENDQVNVLTKRNVWAVNVRELWMDSREPGRLLFTSAFFPLVPIRVTSGPAELPSSHYNCYDPYGISRAHNDGLVPPAMTNINEGFTPELEALESAQHAGKTLFQVEEMAREYLNMENLAGGADPDSDECALYSETAERLKSEIQQFVAAYGPKRRTLVLRGIEMVKTALTPSLNAPLSESSRLLALEIERIRAKSEAEPGFLEEMWDAPDYFFPGLTVHQHAFAYMLNVMSLMQMYCMHTLACMFFLAMASMPWERSAGLMPLHLLLVGKPALGKSFFLDILTNMSFSGIVQNVTALSTKFFANKPTSGCSEGALAGLCIVMQEIYSEMFNPNSLQHGEKATFLKTLMTDNKIGVFRTEKNEATGVMSTVRFTLANYSALVMASNHDITDAAHQDRIVTVCPNLFRRSDGRTATQLRKSTLVEDQQSTTRAYNTYRATSVELGFYLHLANANVVKMPECLTTQIHESMYERACVSYGAQHNTARMSNVLHRMAKHYALLGAVTAVFRGGASFIEKKNRLPDDTECILHVEALAAVPSDLDQTIHFTSLQSKNFDTFAMLGLRLIAFCMAGVRVGQEYVMHDELHSPLETDFDGRTLPDSDLFFAKKPFGIYSSECSPDQLMDGPWAFVYPGNLYKRQRNGPVTEITNPRETLLVAAARTNKSESEVFSRFAKDLIEELRSTDRPHSFPTDESTIKSAIHKLANGSRQALKFHQLEGETSMYALVVNLKEMKNALMNDVLTNAVADMVHAATPVGTMLIASPKRVIKDAETDDDRFEVSKPCYVRVPWHDDECFLYENSEGMDPDVAAEEGLRSRRPAFTSYNPKYWARMGCTCFRSKKVQTVANPRFIDNERLFQMRMRTDQINSARARTRTVEWPIELEQFFVSMIGLGYDPFDEDVQDKYCPLYNRKTWFPDSGANALRAFTDGKYPEGNRNV